MPASPTSETTNSFAGRGSSSFLIPTLMPISAALTVEKNAVFSPSSSSALAASFNRSCARSPQSQQWVSIRNLIEPPRFRIDFVVEVRADPTLPFVFSEPALLRLRLVRDQPRHRLAVPRDDDLFAVPHLEQQP